MRNILQFYCFISTILSITVVHSFINSDKWPPTRQYQGRSLSDDAIMSLASCPPIDTDNNVGQMYGGIVFIKTRDLASVTKFYTETIGMQLWLEQPNIVILHHGNMILGFHQIQNLNEQEPDLQGMYTFVYPTLEQVDEMHTKLQHIADGEPRHNERYRIYQFFAKDPENRELEFQAFLHPLKEVSSAVLNNLGTGMK